MGTCFESEKVKGYERRGIGYLFHNMCLRRPTTATHTKKWKTVVIHYSDDVLGCSIQVLVLTVGRCHNPAGGDLAVLLFNTWLLGFTIPYAASRLKVQSVLIYYSMGLFYIWLEMAVGEGAPNRP